MTAEHAALTHHPAPHRDRVVWYETMFGLLGGPAAWFVQLCVGYSLASWPCFLHGTRGVAPLEGYGWTFPAMIIVLIAGVVIALAALLVSWRIYQRTYDEVEGTHHELMEAGAGRTRFLALWGVLLGGGFAVATVVTVVAFIVLPRCAG